MFGYGETNITSKQVSERYNISINTASNRLNEMYHRRWLKRKKNPNVSNGYVYSLRNGGLKMLRWMKEKNLPRPCRYSEQYLMELAYKNNIRIH